jgi:predicted RNase H-like nuclease (RuvC/YqgF family)
MGKSPRSFSIDEDLDELLSQRDDINASAVVNSFLREYVAGGRGREAALETRVQQLDEEIADLEMQLERKRRERDRLEEQLSSERETTREAVAEFVQLIRDGNFDRANLSPDNEAVVKKASEAGTPTEQFIEEVQARL